MQIIVRNSLLNLTGVCLKVICSQWQAEKYFFIVCHAAFPGLVFHFSFIADWNVSSTWVYYPFAFVVYLLMYGEIWDIRVNLYKERKQGL